MPTMNDSTLSTNLAFTNANVLSPGAPSPNIDVEVQGFQIKCSQVVYNGFVQATNVAQSVLPGTSLASFIYIRHAGTSDFIVVVFKGGVANATQLVLDPGGYVVFANNQRSAVAADYIGVCTVNSANGTTQPVEVLVGVIS